MFFQISGALKTLPKAFGCEEAEFCKGLHCEITHFILGKIRILGQFPFKLANYVPLDYVSSKWPDISWYSPEKLSLKEKKELQNFLNSKKGSKFVYIFYIFSISSAKTNVF